MPVQQLATNSLITFCNSQGDEARGTLLKLTRSTVIFEVYNPYSIVQLSEVLNNLTILRSQHTIYNGRAVVSNLVNTGLIIVISATLIDPWSDLADILNDGAALHLEIEQFIDDWEHANKLQPDYQLAVTNLRGFLGELNRWLEQIEIHSEEETKHNSPVLYDEVFKKLAEPILRKLDDLFRSFEHAAGNIIASETMHHKIFTQRDLHPLMLQAPFIYRAYHKPLGYAGDYEMVNMMLGNGREGNTTYAQLLNVLYLKVAPVLAHQNRIDILIEYLERITQDKDQSEPVRILNIGCGPAIEIQRFLNKGKCSRNVFFRLIDFNDETLEYTRSTIEKISETSDNNPVFDYVHMSVHSLLKQSGKNINIPEDEKFNFVYCAGLFDYLSDKVCSRLISLFYAFLKNNGSILVTNVHSDNPNRWAMEHIAEWYLIYRDEKNMANLASDYKDKHIFKDKTGVNIFMEIKHTS